MGGIDNFYAPPAFHYNNYPYCDKKEGVIFDQKVDIFMVELSYADNAYLLNTLSTFLSNNSTLVIHSVNITPNPFDVLSKPIGAFYYIARIFTAVCFCFCFYCLFNALRVFRMYVKSSTKLMRSMAFALLFTIVGNVFRLVCFIDPRFLMFVFCLISISHFVAFYFIILFLDQYSV